MHILINPIHHNAGMFSYIWETLRGIYRFPNQKYYIKYGKESCYYDNELSITQEITNVWEYYFEQPHYTIQPQEEFNNVIHVSHDKDSEYRDIYLSEEEYKEQRKKYNAIINQYVKLLPHMEEKIKKFSQEKFQGNKILGIHCRGTDHPDSKNIEHYIDEIDAHIQNFDYLFICSDEQSRVDFLKEKYKEKIIEYNTSFRSHSSSPIHYQNNSVINPYFIGEDVIIEAYLLAKTNMLLCCTGSNVNFFIRALNINLPYKILS
jgi:hypothetical protein